MHPVPQKEYDLAEEQEHLMENRPGRILPNIAASTIPSNTDVGSHQIAATANTPKTNAVSTLII